MILSKQSLGSITKAGVKKPVENVFELPEKILQFGTGVLLRGLIDDFVDKANRTGIFNGRIVVVKSTSTGGTDAFATQDGLFTQLIKGIDNGTKVDEIVINSSISRVLAASDEWAEILKIAASPNLQIIFSNTTEVGIALLPEDKVTAAPPKSFPGKLLAVLLKRYETFGGTPESGFVIVPTELVVDNGIKLKGIVKELAVLNGLSEAFISWLETANDFCNSLVDRIVPGKPSDVDKQAAETALGYSDDLLIMSECYRLWAIETSSERSKGILSFSKADVEGVVIVPDINKFRELKLRLLNGTHTFSTGLAIAGGFTTVKEAMANETFSNFITNVSNNEMAPAILNKNITIEDARAFAGKVLDRFRNPFIEHLWLSISVQYTSKMKMRNVPILHKYFAANDTPPKYMALGFAAYILFMKSHQNEEGKYVGTLNGKKYTITDDYAHVLHDHWLGSDAATVVDFILKDVSLWDLDLSSLPGFSDAVTTQLAILIDEGFEAAVKGLA
ncbi:tagaturonate reductase [Parasediminibacterium sp. JCM 36343]|uniref:tagaturonate reductase n=1 Tax=Parasediminibacterium sp. JCM 36343 TaxID=3374279 RepID=UPI00397E643B